LPKHIAGGYLITGAHANGPFRKVAILRFPTIVMRNDNTVPTFTARHIRGVIADLQRVCHAVTDAAHDTRGSGKHINARCLCCT